MNNLLTISEFAKLSGITRANLIYYEKEEILIPVKRQENNYRMYSYRQLDLAYVITSLRNLGVSLKDIKSYTQTRTPEVAQALFVKQVGKIEDQIDKLIQMKEILNLHIQNIKEFQQTKLPLLEVRELEKEIICLGPNSEEEEELNSILEFIKLCRDNQIHYVNHIGKIFSKEKFLKENFSTPDRFYIKSTKGEVYKEKGNYVVLMEEMNGREKNEFYQKIKVFIDSNQLEIYGNTYEEYILDELAVKNPEEYVIKITARVKAKEELLLK